LIEEGEESLINPIPEKGCPDTVELMSSVTAEALEPDDWRALALLPLDLPLALAWLIGFGHRLGTLQGGSEARNEALQASLLPAHGRSEGLQQCGARILVYWGSP
jgi:hypothetical protein